MNQKEKKVLEIEESFKDVLENEVKKENTKTKKIEIKDIKYVGNASWKDKINGKQISEEVFIVEKEIIEVNENGKEEKKDITNYYLGEKCIGGKIGDMQPQFSTMFKEVEPDKMNAINELLENVSERDIQLNSMNNLKNKELAEILSAYVGRKIEPQDIERELEKMDKKEIEDLKEEKKEKKDNKEKLTKKQTDKIRVNGIQEADLNKLADGKETLGKRLDLQGYDKICVIYSERIDEISGESNKNNTEYSLVGISRDGTAKRLDDEFSIDSTVGSSANREETKIRADNTATRDNRDKSVYTRKSNGASIGCENDMGNINMFLYQKTLEENENVGIQVETSKTPVIPIETKNVMNRNKGIYQKEKVQDEIQKHTDEGCKPKDVKDFDGEENTETHEHFEKKYINMCVQEIFNFEDSEGEEKIKEVFTEKEVRDKFLRELKENKDKISIEQIKENVKQEMDDDAGIYTKEHNI